MNKKLEQAMLKHCSGDHLRELLAEAMLADYFASEGLYRRIMPPVLIETPAGQLRPDNDNSEVAGQLD